jgi:asparagine synthase (glutamine-hydrolysing)
VIAHRVPADEWLDYDCFLAPPDLDEPYAGLWRLAMDRASLDLAARIGANTVLSGIGSDEIHHVLPHHLADLLGRGRVLATWSEAVRWAHWYNCSPWTLLREYATPRGTPLWWLRRWIARLAGRGHGGLDAQDDWSVPPWIAPGFARRYDLHERALAQIRRDRPEARLPNAVIQALEILAERPGDVVRWAIGAPHGIAYGHPFLDCRVVAFGLGILTRLRPDPGPMKPVLAEAFRDLLPDSVRTRRSKIGYNALYFTGLSRNLPYLERMIRTAPDPAWDLFDREALLGSLRQASLAGTGVRKLARLNYTLALIR